MQPSIFNLRVPLEARREVFLMNTLTDAQLVVSEDVDDLLRECPDPATLTGNERDALALLEANGFIVTSREADRRALHEYMTDVKSDTSELNVTVLTTLQCNFACDYCFQGDHGDYNERAEKMSLATAERVGDWIERELDRVRPGKLVLTFFGGEPLLNLPVVYALAERAWNATFERSLPLYVNVITNGLLLTPEVVDRLLPYGLNGVKITLDGDRDTHNRMRPLRGGQGTFDRIIRNIEAVAGRCRIAIGGNFDESSVDSFPDLLAFLRQQGFADKLAKVNFKPVVRTEPSGGGPGAATVAAARAERPGWRTGTVAGRTVIPLTPVSAKETLHGTCMTSVGSGAGAACDSCNVLDDKMSFLRDETRRLGFPTHDGVHNGPCHVHKAHAHTIGPDGSLYPCPGFTGQLALSTGHIDDRKDEWREIGREVFNRLEPWKDCGDCAFIPVCAGGCAAASHSQLGDMNAPTCHKRSFESALISLAHTAAGAA